MARAHQRKWLIVHVYMPYPPVIQISTAWCILALKFSFHGLASIDGQRQLSHTTRVTVVPIFMQERKVIHNDTTNNSAVEVRLKGSMDRHHDAIPTFDILCMDRWWKSPRTMLQWSSNEFLLNLSPAWPKYCNCLKQRSGTAEMSIYRNTSCTYHLIRT